MTRALHTSDRGRSKGLVTKKAKPDSSLLVVELRTHCAHIQQVSRSIRREINIAAHRHRVAPACSLLAKQPSTAASLIWQGTRLLCGLFPPSLFLSVSRCSIMFPVCLYAYLVASVCLYLALLLFSLSLHPLYLSLSVCILPLPPLYVHLYSLSPSPSLSLPISSYCDL